MTDNEIKQKVVEILHKTAAGEGLDKDGKKWLKVYNCVYGQWANAKVEDVEIMRMDKRAEQVVTFSFRADRYYQWILSDGSVSNTVKKNDPWKLNNLQIGVPALGHVYKIELTEEEAKRELIYKWMLEKTLGNLSDKEIIINKKGYTYFDKLLETIKKGVDAIYRAENETYLYNNPQKTYKIDISEFSIDSALPLEVPVCAMLLNVKDSKGKTLKMNLGYYFEKTETFDCMFAYISKYVPYLYDENWKSIQPHKSWFKWVL